MKKAEEHEKKWKTLIDSRRLLSMIKRLAIYN
jgi:hypothetical protein